MSVIGTGGAECADAQPASRVAVSTIRTAMLINRDGFMWHNLPWEKENHLEVEASNRTSSWDHRRCRRLDESLDPALALGSYLELLGDLLGRTLGRTLDGGAAADLSFDLRRTADDEADRVAAGHRHGEGQRLSRALGAGRVELRRAPTPQALTRHHITLQRRSPRPRARPERHG